MAQVTLFGTLAQAAAGQSEMELDAPTIKSLFTQLEVLHPRLRPHFERGVSLSIDGQVFRDPGYQDLRPDSEVVILPKMTGG